jgi:polyphenol oxidase
VFAFRDERASVEVAFTDRFGGLSAGPYAELNLTAQDPGDWPEVDRNRELVARALGDDVRGVVSMRQVHGAEVVRVDPATWGTETPPADEPVADALVTRTPGWVLVARAADCVPVLLADPDEGVAAAVHAGRAGLVAGVVPEAMAALAELGARRVTAWVGPRVCGRCYEVPARMREAVAGRQPEAWAETSWGTPALDIGAGVLAQLRAGGAEVVDVARCTVEDTDFYSFRRQGPRSGRHAGLVWVRP